MKLLSKSFRVMLWLGLFCLSLFVGHVSAQSSGPGVTDDDEETSVSALLGQAHREPSIEKNMDPKTSIRVSLQTSKSTAQVGEEVTITAEVDRDCYLSVMSFGDAGKIRVLWPLGQQGSSGKVKANSPVQIPSPGQGFRIIPDGTSAVERVVAIAVDRKDAIFKDGDFEQSKGNQPRAFVSDKADLINEFSTRVTDLDPSVKWGTAELAIQIVKPGEPAAPVAGASVPEGRVKVTLHIYSGRPDPSWLLTREQSLALVEKLRTVDAQTLKTIPEVFEDVGYRGFSIEGLPDLELKGPVLIYDDIIEIDGRVAKRLNIPAGELEHWLLQTAGDAVDPELRSAVKAEIAKPKPKGPPLGSELDDEEQFEPKRFSRNENPPPYEPRKWNRRGIVGNNNCYNYGTNRITNSYAQVGKACSREVTKITCAAVTRGAVCDGLVYLGVRPKSGDELDEFELNGPAMKQYRGTGGHIAAVIVSRGRDYHWYRFDKTGRWSHKMGGHGARDYDGRGRKMFKNRRIVDLRRASLPYRDFCGYFYVPAGFRPR